MARSRRWHRVRTLGVTLLILGLGHVPLPAPDYHSIRHHDGPGEVCEHHDHLLRWHPDAGPTEDVAVLHWHLFLPAPGAGDQAPGRSGPAMHAHVADLVAPTWDDLPQIERSQAVRSLDRAVTAFVGTMVPPVDGPAGVSLRRGPGPVHAFSATFAPRAPLTALLARWAC
jgi:hypothetical protein